MLTFGNKFNRSYGIYLPFRGTYASTTVFFNKTNTYLGFVIDKRLSQMCSNNEAKTHIYRDLKQSSFASTFLDIQDIKAGNLDIRNQFCNVLPKHRQKIQYIGNETIKLAKVEAPNGKTFESSLYIYILGFSDYEGDFIYVLAERQHIDVSINKKLVRTSAIQISTPDCLDNLRSMVQYHNGQSEEELNMTEADNENVIRDVLNTSSKPNTQPNNDLALLLGNSETDVVPRKM
jgi:hypothetical protein